MIQYQILQIYIIGIVWLTVRRITNEILGVKELGSWWDYSARTQIVNEGTISNLHSCYIGMHSFSADQKCVIFS